MDPTLFDRIPSSPPPVPSLPAGVERPLWTVAVPCYNSIAFLPHALNSVLSQDPGPTHMQVLVVDDHSTDGDVETLIKSLSDKYNRPIGFIRHQQNRGSLHTFHTAITNANGHHIHLLHADDMVKPGYYQEIEFLFASFPAAGAAFVKHTYMNERGYEIQIAGNVEEEPGLVKDWLFRIAGEVLVQPPAMTVKREVYEQLGSFYAAHYGEDWEMWARIAKHYPVAYSPKALAMYRVHNNNISAQWLRSGQVFKDIQKISGIITTYLPAEQRKAAQTKSFSFFSKFFAQQAYASAAKDLSNATRLARKAVSLHTNRVSVSILSRLYLQQFVTMFQSRKQ